MANIANLVVTMTLMWTCPMVLAKGIILYGKGKVVVSKKTTPMPPSDDTEDGTDRFQFALYTPTARSAKPSESFEKFSRQAISARLAGHSRQRTYYFMQEKKTYDTEWMVSAGKTPRGIEGPSPYLLFRPTRMYVKQRRKRGSYIRMVASCSPIQNSGLLYTFCKLRIRPLCRHHGGHVTDVSGVINTVAGHSAAI